MRLLAYRGQSFECVEDVLASMVDYPVPRQSAFIVKSASSPYRISASLSSMARCSACLTAICSRSDSQEHSGYGGALQMAQFGDASISRVKAWRASANHRRSRVGQTRLGSCLKTRYAGRVRLRCGVSSV